MSTTFELPKAVEDALRGSTWFSRRGFLRFRARLVVELRASARILRCQALAQPSARAVSRAPDFLKLDTWIVIHPDNSGYLLGRQDGVGQSTGTDVPAVCM